MPANCLSWSMSNPEGIAAQAQADGGHVGVSGKLGWTNRIRTEDAGAKAGEEAVRRLRREDRGGMVRARWVEQGRRRRMIRNMHLGSWWVAMDGVEAFLE